MSSLTKVKLNNIDTSVTFIYDPLVLLNYGSTLANTDIGFVFNRDGGISSNVALYWNETTDRVTIAYTSASGLPNSNVTITKMANVAADWYFGNLAGGTTNTVWVSANVLPTANAFYNFGSPTQRWNVGYFAATTLDLGGSQISVDPTNGFKFTVGSTGTPIYLASNGALSGTTLSTSGTISADGAINTKANVLASQVSAGSIVTTGVVNAGGNVLASTGIFNLLDVNGNVEIGSVGTPGAGHSIIGNIVQSGAGTIFFNTPGNILAQTANVGQIGVVNNLVVGQSTFVGELFVTTRAGDEGGQLNLAPAVTNNTLVGNVVIDVFQNRLRIFESGGTNRGGYFDISSLATSAGTNFGAGGGGGGSNYGNANVAQYLPTYTGTIGASLINSTGNILATGAVLNALTVNGNESVTGFLNVTGNIIALTADVGGIEATGVIYANSTIQSSTITNGALVVAGGVGISRDVHIGGNLTVNGNVFVNGNTVTINANNLTINDGMIFLAEDNPADTIDLGFIGHYTSPTLLHAGFVRDATDGVWKLFTNVAPNPTTTVDFTNAIYSPLYLGSLTAVGNVLSTGLRVFGNTSIGLAGAVSGQFHTVVGNITQTSSGGAVYINTTGNVLATAGVFNGLTVNGGITSTGFINTSGNVSGAVVNAGVVNSTGNVLATTGRFNNVTVNTGNINAVGGFFVGNGFFLTGIVSGGGGGGGFVYTVSASPPVTSNAGDVWYDSGTDTLFQRINDGTNTVWVDVAGLPLNINTVVQGTSLSVTGAGTVLGNLSTGNVIPVTSNVFSLGSSSNWYSRIWGQAVNALYADLAEKYSGDADYDSGTVVIFGGIAEVTKSVNSHDPAIAGVVSTNPAYLMNSNQEGISVALTGRVPCWVKGPINKGDRVVSSDIPGVGEKLNLDKYQPGCIIGKSLESLNNDEIKKIEVVVGRI